MPTYNLLNGNHVRIFAYLNGAGEEVKIDKDKTFIELANQKNNKFYVGSDLTKKSGVSEECSYLISPDASWEELEEIAKKLKLKNLLNRKAIMAKDIKCLFSIAGNLAFQYFMNNDWWENFLIENNISKHIYQTGDSCLVFEDD